MPDTWVFIAAIPGACAGAAVWWLYSRFRPGRPWMRIALPLAVLAVWLVLVVVTLLGHGEYVWDGAVGFLIVWMIWVGSGRFHAAK